jgi:tetratricopeptide (TPR) repeat protein
VGVLLLGLAASLLLPQGNVARTIAPTPASNQEPASAADATDASRFDPRTWQARNELGRSETFRGNYDTAIAEYTAALALLDDEPADESHAAVRNEILARRCYALVQARRFTDAADGYTAIHSADTTGLAAKLWDLQQAAAEGGDIQAARDILQRLESLVRPGAPQEGTILTRWEILNTLAWYLASDPDSDEASGRRAVELANEALLLVGGENRAQVLDSLAAAHARAGEWEKALQQIDAAIEGTKDSGLRADFQLHREAFEQRCPWDRP